MENTPAKWIKFMDETEGVWDVTTRAGASGMKPFAKYTRDRSPHSNLCRGISHRPANAPPKLRFERSEIDRHFGGANEERGYRVAKLWFAARQL